MVDKNCRSGFPMRCLLFTNLWALVHWDRRGTQDEKSSCWVRAAQPWAGNGWGAMMIPRIGQEVVVSFLEGDPDRPLITGNVYNAQQTAPYQLPGKMTTSTIRSPRPSSQSWWLPSPCTSSP